MALSKSAGSRFESWRTRQIMKKIFPRQHKLLYGIPIAFFSLEIYLGVLFGYFLSNFWSQRIKSITFTVGSYKVHLHHWLLALWALPVVVIYNFSPIPVQFASGFLGGLIVQGVFSYDDWHKVLIKKT